MRCNPPLATTRALVLAVGLGVSASAAVPLGSSLELFVDDFLIERLEGAALKLHEPVCAGVALRFDRPWEGAFCGYVTVLRDADKFEEIASCELNEPVYATPAFLDGRIYIRAETNLYCVGR